MKVHEADAYTANFVGAISCPDSIYFADSGINNSGLHTIHTKSPYHYQMLKKYDQDRTSSSFRLGHLIHALVLGTPSMDFFIPYTATKTLKGKAYEEFKAHLKETGREGEIVLQSEIDQANNIYKYACEQNSLIRDLQEKADHTEVAGFLSHMGYRCKAKADALELPENDGGDGVIWDVKTTGDLFDFQRSARNYGYHMQQAWYQFIFQTILKRRFDYRLLVIEKNYPYSVVEYNFSDRVKDQGRIWMEKSFAKYCLAVDTGVWAKPETKITIDWRY